MEEILHQHLNKLLDAYSHLYDIRREVEVDGTVFPAAADYFLRDENYLISRQHVLSAVEQHEYVYFFLTDHLDTAALTYLTDLTRAHGLSRIRPHKEHMCSYVTLVVLANTIDPEAVKQIKKTRFRKNYRMSFHGWMEYRVAAMSVTENRFWSNPAGTGARKLLEQNLAPKKANNLPERMKGAQIL